MLFTHLMFRIVFLMPAAALLAGATGMKPANATIGKNLQAGASIAFDEPVPVEGLEVTLTSDDPGKLLLAKTPEAAGSPSITVPVKGEFRASPEFWLHALADSGSVTYTATVPGLGSSKGTVTLAPSAIIIVGPFGGPTFPTTRRAEPSRLVLYPVRLDASLKYAEQQLIAGGLSVKVHVTSSDIQVGTVNPSSVTMSASPPNAVVAFQPSSPGKTKLAVDVPSGFTAPAAEGAVTAIVRTPGIALTGQVMVGQNLQLGGVVGLGEAAAESVPVTLTSEDPKRLLLSRTGKEVGSESLTIEIPPGQVSGSFYLQALGNSGTVNYSASAPGYASRTAAVGLTPSGVVITPSPYGPPDEAELFRKETSETPRGFVASLSKPEKMNLLVWTVQLDPATLRSADVTVQPLRAGMSLTVGLNSSDPAVGTIVSPVTIAAGAEHGTTTFTPVGRGSTKISVVTPEGFTTSSNSTAVSAVVRD
jgi:hypothetical protein